MNLKKLWKLIDLRFLTMFVTLGLVVLSLAAAFVDSSTKVNAAVNHPNPTDFHIITADGSVRDLTLQGLNEHVTSQGVYYVTYRFTYPSRNAEIRFPLTGVLHRCDGGNGNATGPYAGIACVDPQAYTDNRYVALDSSNNFTQDITFSSSQPYQRVCGSFQSDIFAPSSNNQFITGSFYKTGMDCNQPTPTPSPSPTPTPTPTPSSSPTMTPTPQGQLKVVKYHDRNGNGSRDFAEEGLVWGFEITFDGLKFNLNTLGDGTIIQTVDGGKTYTVTEADLAGWFNTTPKTQTVVVQPGTITEVVFGNKQVDASPSPSPIQTPSPSPSASPSPSPSTTPYPSTSPSPSVTPTPYPSVSPSPSPSISPTPYPSMSPTPYPSPSVSPSPSATPTPYPSKTPYPSMTPTPSASPYIVCKPEFQKVKPGETVNFTLEYGNLQNNIDWSAPGANPEHGLGDTFSTSFANTGHYTVTVESGNFAKSICNVKVISHEHESPNPSPSSTPTPSPSVSPSETPYPSMSPSASPSSAPCPGGYVQKMVDSMTVCVSQDQSQNQSQTQNNNQNQNVNQNVNATGGSSSSSSSSDNDTYIKISNYDRPIPNSSPWPQWWKHSDGKVLGYATTAVYNPQADANYIPRVVGSGPTSITELPRTGLPLLALGLAGAFPGGLIIKRLTKKQEEKESASDIWNNKQLKK